MKLTDLFIAITCAALFAFALSPARPKTHASQVYIGGQGYSVEYFEGHQYLVHASGAICQLPDTAPEPSYEVNPNHSFIGRDKYGRAIKLPND